MKKIFYLVFAVLLAAVLAWGLRLLSRNSGEPPKSAIQTTRAELRDIRETLSATGEVAPARKTPVKSEVSGRIAKLHAGIGAEVLQGGLLVELDRSELLSQKQELLRAIEAAVLRQQKAQRDYERLQSLHTQGYVTDKEHQDADTELRLADNQLEAEQARLQTLEEKLSRTSILAPQDGVVITCDVEEGEVIVGANSAGQGTVIMEVADLTRLLVKADINEVDVVRLSNSALVELTFDSVPGILATGAIRYISPAARLRAQETIRTFPVEIACEAVDPRVRPGITANILAPLSAVSQAVAVVVSAVFSDSTNRVVFLKTGETYERRRVEPGINDAQYVEIKTGLSAGDEIATTRPPEFAKGEEGPDPSAARRARRMMRRR